jgi:toxin secretion/phage lysis holin
MLTVMHWMKSVPALMPLLILMGLDIAMGLFVAIATKRLSSSASWKGMARKVCQLILVAVAAVIEPFANGMPVLSLACMSFIVTETISIMENAAQAGVPLPGALVELLAKLKDSKGTPPPVTLTIPASVVPIVVQAPAPTPAPESTTTTSTTTSTTTHDPK